jgi:hypothetical protein
VFDWKAAWATLIEKFIGSESGKNFQNSDFVDGPSHIRLFSLSTLKENGVFVYSIRLIFAKLFVDIVPRIHNARISLGAKEYKIISLPLDFGDKKSHPKASVNTKFGLCSEFGSENLSLTLESEKYVFTEPIGTEFPLTWINNVSRYIHSSLGLETSTLEYTPFVPSFNWTSEGVTFGSCSAFSFLLIKESAKQQPTITTAQSTAKME